MNTGPGVNQCLLIFINNFTGTMVDFSVLWKAIIYRDLQSVWELEAV